MEVGYGDLCMDEARISNTINHACNEEVRIGMCINKENNLYEMGQVEQSIAYSSTIECNKLPDQRIVAMLLHIML